MILFSMYMGDSVRSVPNRPRGENVGESGKIKEWPRETQGGREGPAPVQAASSYTNIDIVDAVHVPGRVGRGHNAKQSEADMKSRQIDGKQWEQRSNRALKQLLTPGPFVGQAHSRAGLAVRIEREVIDFRALAPRPNVCRHKENRGWRSRRGCCECVGVWLSLPEKHMLWRACPVGVCLSRTAEHTPCDTQTCGSGRGGTCAHLPHLQESLAVAHLELAVVVAVRCKAVTKQTCG